MEFDFSGKVQAKAIGYHIKERDVMFAYLLAAGADRADSYAAIYQTARRMTRDSAEASAKEFLSNNPGVKVLVGEIQRGFRTAREQVADIDKEEELTEREREKFSSREGLLEMAQKNLRRLTGKDELQGIQFVAKMQGLDKPEEKAGDDHRTYFLPWVSHCRSCALMKAYIKSKEGQG